MTVNISKRLLGMACIIAGAFIPLILGTLNWLPSGFDLLEAAEFIHLTTPLLLTVMAITVLVNLRESSEARGRGGTRLEQLPRNAATLLTGAVGMLLLFTYLPDRIPGHQPLQPDFTHHYSLRLRPDQHRPADGDRMTDNARKVAGNLAIRKPRDNGRNQQRRRCQAVAVQDGAGAPNPRREAGSNPAFETGSRRGQGAKLLRNQRAIPHR